MESPTTGTLHRIAHVRTCMEILTRPKSSTVQRPDPLARLEQFYRAAKKHQWDVNDLPWGEAPPVPRFESERWQRVWSSVIQQQLQADLIAIEASNDLLLNVEEKEARLYYSTMVQDEGRHVEGWMRLADTVDFAEGHNPYLEEMNGLFRESTTLEEKVISFQVGFEGAAIFAFKDIAASARSSVLGAMAGKLVRDDSIHHNSGVAYAEHLLTEASPSLKRHIGASLKRFGPLYVENVRWRPQARQWMARFMRDRDLATIQRNQVQINRCITALGIEPIFDI